MQKSTWNEIKGRQIARTHVRESLIFDLFEWSNLRVDLRVKRTAAILK